MSSGQLLAEGNITENKVERPLEENLFANVASEARPDAILDWRKVESEDYKQYIENLRAIGCPEETIEDIIVADVNKLLKSRNANTTGNTNKFEYWKIGNPMAAL